MTLWCAANRATLWLLEVAVHAGNLAVLKTLPKLRGRFLGENIQSRYPGIRGSYYNTPKAIIYLLEGNYNNRGEGCFIYVFSRKP